LKDYESLEPFFPRRWSPFFVDGSVAVAMHVDLWDFLVGRLRNLQFVKGYCLTVKDGEPALGFVLDGGEIICAIKRPVSGPEKGLQ
jgi:hypothetical protein